MGDIRPYQRYSVDLRRLRGEERSKMAAKIWEKSVDGLTLTELSEKYDASKTAVKTLLEEHAAAETMARDAQRSVSIGVYRRAIKLLWQEWQKGIDEGDLSPRSVNTSKIPEAISNLQSRIDKLTGVEAPTMSVSASGGTLKDLLYGATADGQDPEIVYEIEEADAASNAS